MIRLAACLALVTCAAGAAEPGPQGQQDLSLPESVLQDASAGAIYCSSIGGREPTAAVVTAKDGDGFISLLRPDGTVIDQRAFPLPGDTPLNGPKGMTLLGDQLWVADIDRVVGFDVASRKELAAIDLASEKVAFANDLLAIDGKRFLVSDTVSGAVLVVEPGAAVKTILKLDPPLVVEGANGLARGADGKLVVAQYSFAGKELQLTRVAVDWTTLKRGEAEILPFPAGQWDGLAVAKDATIYASDWKTGAIWTLRTGDHEATKLAGGGGFKGPADFWLLADESAILCPDLVTQQIKVIKLGRK